MPTTETSDSTDGMKPELAFLGPKGTYSHQVSNSRIRLVAIVSECSDLDGY